MSFPELFSSPAFPRALVIAAFGGVGLSLTSLYSRRGPMIFPVYAAILAALALVLARYPALRYSQGFSAAFAGFLVAGAAHYVTVCILAGRSRRRLVDEGWLPETARNARLPLFGHVWRLSVLAAVGVVVSAAVAFVAT